MAKTKKTGHPKKFKSVKKLQDRIDSHFDSCDEADEPYTITGLALELGTSRQTLCDYERDPKFSDTIKRAKARCENWIELATIKREVPPAVGIFILKNYGWTDRPPEDGETDQPLKIVYFPIRARDSEEWQQMVKADRRKRQD